MVAKHSSSSDRDKPRNQHYSADVDILHGYCSDSYQLLNMAQVMSRRKIERKVVPPSSRLRSSALN
jgi:hypothetical protein